jgi:hypothetical protein
MNRLHVCSRLALLLPLAATLLASPARAQQWTAPTPEELHMTSIAEVPGAEAVILNHEELHDDDNHMESIYYRIKVLSEGGIKYGDVEMQYDKRRDLLGSSVGDISGRTVQPDGTVVPFTGKPYDKLLHKDKDNAYTARVFSLPAVQVGSILEFRYTKRWDDRMFFRPYWIIQNELYLRKGHFRWKATDHDLLHTSRGGRENIANRLTWAQSLPKGTTVKETRLPTGRLVYDLDVADIPPFGNEEYMPPIASSRYHVFFYYTPYASAQEYWSTEIKFWSSDTGKFARPTGYVQQEAQADIAGATADEDKARKLYLAVMKLENTDYTRQRSTQEEKDEIKSAEDVLKRKHGTSAQITMTYVAMARSVGLQAYVMAVADRSSMVLDSSWMDFESQLTDSIAVVKYGDVDHYLDPGSRYATFGHLEWTHTLAGGVRQDNPDKVKLFMMTPGEGYKFSHTSRVGDLKLEADGHMTGTLTFTYEGSPALRWRHLALQNDEGELRERMKKELEGMLPGGSQVEVKTISGLTDGEVPLKVSAIVVGNIGNSVGSRVMLPSALFEANSQPTFPHDKRDLGVYFPYTQITQDAVRYTLPAGFTVEAAPAKEVAQYQNLAAYAQTSSQAANTVTVRRDLILGDVYFPVAEYPQLRTFYNDFEHKDHGSVVLKRSSETASAK